MSKREFTCEQYLPEVIVVRGRDTFSLHYNNKVTLIENLKFNFYIFKHVVISEYMNDFLNIGDNFDIIITHDKRKIDTGDNFEQIERIKDVQLVLKRSDHIVEELEEYTFVFKKSK